MHQLDLQNLLSKKKELHLRSMKQIKSQPYQDRELLDHLQEQDYLKLKYLLQYHQY